MFPFGALAEDGKLDAAVVDEFEAMDVLADLSKADPKLRDAAAHVIGLALLDVTAGQPGLFQNFEKASVAIPEVGGGPRRAVAPPPWVCWQALASDSSGHFEHFEEHGTIKFLAELRPPAQ
ncbi:MAG: hypothetical protein ACKV19_25590 [Verrucomicrobiales bacterium]